MNCGHYDDLKYSCVLISGGASGIGRAMVEGFLAQGARVAFLDLDQDAAASLVAAMQHKYGREPLFVCCDLADVDALQQAVQAVREQLGAISVLVNNAANDQRMPFAELTAAQWQQSLAVNLTPYFFLAQAVSPDMRQLGHGSIINVSSNAPLLGLTGYPAYVAAKSAIFGLTKSLARELGTHHIRVNSLVPGWVMTAKQRELWATPPAVAACLASQAIAQTLEESDIVAGALFLASSVSRLLTGQSLVIDGGRL